MTFRQRVAFFSLLVLCSLSSCSILQPAAGTAGKCLKFTISTFDTSPALIDNNQKVIVDLGIAKLAPDADVFGAVINGWTEMSYGEILPAGSGIGKGNAALSEAGRILTTIDGGSGDWSVAARRNVSYLDADIVWRFSDTDYKTGTTYGATLTTHLWVAQDTCIRFYDYVRAAAVYGGSVQKVINGVTTSLGDYTHTPSMEKYYRIKLVRGAGSCIATAYTSTDGSNWVQRGSGECYDATYFNENTPVYPIAMIYCENSPDTFTPDLTNFYQYTGNIPAQRFWNDSPEVRVVGSEKVEWAFDAGQGKAWKLTGASAAGSQPGTSSIKFKVGLSDSPERESATWYDNGNWKTISEINAAAENGELDGYRYIFASAQFNSDGKDQPSLTSFSIRGCTVH